MPVHLGDVHPLRLAGLEDRDCAREIGWDAEVPGEVIQGAARDHAKPALRPEDPRRDRADRPIASGRDHDVRVVPIDRCRNLFTV